MNWHIKWSNKAIKETKILDKTTKDRIWTALDNLLSQPQTVDLKKIKGKTAEYRLRVGEWRVRLIVDFANREYLITHVKHRREIYRDM